MTDHNPSLFDAAEPDRALTGSLTLARRHRDTLLRGLHPISGHPLHGDAADIVGDGPGLRCRDCFYAVPVGDAYKCSADQGRHVTHGGASNLRLSLPACTEHVQDTPLTPP